MDRISGLSDELVIKILSFLPMKAAVSTSVLSKRWEFLWMWLTKLEFDDDFYSEFEIERLQCFLDRNLPLHRAPVIETFRLSLNHSDHYKPEAIKLWTAVVVSRYVRELDIDVFYLPVEQNILASSLYTCKSLVILKLSGTILLDVPRMVCLPSLKTLKLKDVIYFNQGSLQRLLSHCPVLYDLLVEFSSGYSYLNMGKFTVVVPSLRRLSLYMPWNCHLEGFVIDTPCLEYFKLVDHHYDNHPCLIENMPKLTEAYIDVGSADLKSLVRSIISVKRLTISADMVVYGGGFIFNHLVHLTLHGGHDNYSSNILFLFLKDSPNLRELHYSTFVIDNDVNFVVFPWNQPSVPECILSSLQDFSWTGYVGRPQDRDLMVYMLKNARRLKSATIISITRLVPQLEMIKELTCSSRASATCELIFD